MRLAPFALQLGFLLASYTLGLASGRQEAARQPAPPERLPVVGSSGEAAPAVAVALAAEESPPSRAEAQQILREPPAWREIASSAQGWTVAVRADQSYGAGVAVERAGFVLTNLHVVEGAKAITVTPFGAEPATAAMIDSDRELDLALLRTATPLPHEAQIGRSESLGVGDEVMAVGSPRKMYFSVSRGMVSYPNRFLDGVEYIQTDLPINVGNSGGPLVDRQGSVVGIVSFILRDSQGISFALPIDRAVARFGEHLSAELAEEPPSAAPVAARPGKAAKPVAGQARAGQPER